MSKTTLEKEHLQTFVTSLGLDSVSIDLESERPDAILEFNGRRIGLEHTQLHQPDTTKGLIVIAQEKIRDRIVQDAMLKFKRSHSMNLIVDVNTDDYYWINYPLSYLIDFKEMDLISSELCDFVTSNIPSEGSHVQFERIRGESLPRLFNRISIYYPNHERTQRWSRSKGGIVPRVFPDYIEEKINAKNNSLKGYRDDVDEHWLLLVADQADYQHSIVIDHSILRYSFTSDFNKVYLMIIDPVDPLQTIELNLNQV